LPERKIEQKVLLIHEKLLTHYSVLRAERFIQNLELLWETSESSSKSGGGVSTATRLEDSVQPDWLQFALRMCVDKLPPLLTLDAISKATGKNSVEPIMYALYQVSGETTFWLIYNSVLLLLIN
jgi:hypothetical protein